MKNRILSTIIFSFCFVASYAQSQCEALLKDAQKYKNEGEYEKAVEYYNKLEQKCPPYFTETVKKERRSCEEKLKSQNKPKPQKTSSGYVTVYQNESTNNISNKRLEFDADGTSRNTNPNLTVYYNGEWDTIYIGKKPDWLEMNRNGNTLLVFCQPNNTSEDRFFEFQIFLGYGMDGISDTIRVHQEPKGRSVRRKPKEQNDFSGETKEEQPIIVKITFEKGKAKPKFDSNIGRLITAMGENNNLDLQIEVYKCESQSGLKNFIKAPLIDKRFKEIMEYFGSFEIATDRITKNIIVIDGDKEGAECDCAYAKTKKKE